MNKTINKTIKIISIFAILVVLLGVIGQTAFALTLKERDANAKAKYQQAKDQYLKEVNFYKNTRQDFLKARTKYQQFKNTENKEALENAARNQLEKAVTSLIKRLEVIKTWVSNRGALGEAEKQAIITEIDEDIIWLKERESKVQIASVAEIKEAAKEIRDYWKNHRAKVKRVIGEIWAARINFVITKAEKFSIQVSAKIQELKTAGKDTSQLEAWLADFNQKLVLAKEKYEAAKVKFQAISDLAEAQQLFEEGHQFIIQANQYVKQAHTQLVQIVKEMKKMGKTIETEEATTSTEGTSE